VKVKTKAFGLIEVEEHQRITFPQGLFGFESFKDYVLLDAEQEPFYWLQSLDDENVAFVLINPFLFRPNYEMNIDNDEILPIGIKEPDKAVIFTIVTIPADAAPMTANLQGPLIINRENHLGIQAVLTDSRWKTKHDIMAEFEAAKLAASQQMPAGQQQSMNQDRR
jgi:flagellar assembly factor FliW